MPSILLCKCNRRPAASGRNQNLGDTFLPIRTSWNSGPKNSVYSSFDVFFFLTFHWPRTNHMTYLPIMFCSCVATSTHVLLQEVLCPWLMKTTLPGKKKGRTLPDLSKNNYTTKKKTCWSNDKTIIKFDSQNIAICWCLIITDVISLYPHHHDIFLSLV